MRDRGLIHVPTAPGWLRRVTHAGQMYRDPEARMFVGIRSRLTLWYGAVLVAVLILFGAALYVAEDQALLRPIDGKLVSKADAVREAWQADPGGGCPGKTARVTYWVCYGPNGAVLDHGDENDDAPNFPSPSFASSAQSGSPRFDTIAGGSDTGTLRRYARVVRETHGGPVLGTILIATPIQGELDALHLLLALLFIFGAAAVVAGTIGGLFLSGRALEPARIALRRQQAFVADASHELRTPLSLVRADADLLAAERGRLSDDGEMLLDDIVTEVEYMGALASNMLMLTELGTHGPQLEHDVVDLSQVAVSAVRRARAFAASRGVGLEDQSGGPSLVVADRLLLDQAVLILVDNAIKYNRSGGTVCIAVRADGDRAVLEVSDTGVGIAAEHLAHLGERFYRVDKSRSRAAGGAGLGLSIAREVARALGGTVTIESEEGVGTSVRLVLPQLRSN